MTHHNEGTAVVTTANADELPAEHQRLELMILQSNMTVSIFTATPLSKLRQYSEYIRAWDDDHRKCSLCNTTHDTLTLCFADDNLDLPEPEVLQGMLDNTLTFTWTPDGHQFLVFTLCSYF